MLGMRRLLEKLRSRDRRKKDRVVTPQLGAYFWNNAKPVKHAVKDVSPTGLYLVTEERWYPGTLVMMTLQTDEAAADGGKQAVAVQSKAVRTGEDGVGLEFVIPGKGDAPASDTPAVLKTDEKALKTFLNGLLTSGDNS